MLNKGSTCPRPPSTSNSLTDSICHREVSRKAPCCKRPRSRIVPSGCGQSTGDKPVCCNDPRPCDLQPTGRPMKGIKQFDPLPQSNPVENPGDAIFSILATECPQDSEPTSASSRACFSGAVKGTCKGGNNVLQFYAEEYTDEEEEEARVTMDITVTQKARPKQTVVTRQTRSSMLSSDYNSSVNHVPEICEYINFVGVFDPWRNNLLPFWDKIFRERLPLPFCPINPFTPSYFTCGHYPNRRVLFQPPCSDPVYPPNLLSSCPNCPRLSRRCCPSFL